MHCQRRVLGIARKDGCVFQAASERKRRAGFSDPVLPKSTQEGIQFERCISGQPSKPREEKTGVWSFVLLTAKASTRSSDTVPKEFLFFLLGPR